MKKINRKHVFPVVFVALLLINLNFARAEVADYAGVYAGTYSSSGEEADSGIFRCVVDAYGLAQFMMWSTITDSGGWLWFEIDAEGLFEESLEDGDTIINGSISENGEMSGTGASTSEDITSNFSGQIVTETSVHQYMDDYSGVYTGDLSGSWSFTVAPDGRIYSFDDLNLSGAIGPDGILIITSENTGAAIKGEILEEGTIVGYWHIAWNGSSGSVSGSKSDVDDDEDGFTENQGDCDDGDGSVYPGADEICGDGIDQDCDGADDVCDNDDGSDDSDDGADNDGSDDDSTDDDTDSSDDTDDDATDDGTDTDDDSQDTGDSSAGGTSAGCFLSTIEPVR